MPLAQWTKKGKTEYLVFDGLVIAEVEFNRDDPKTPYWANCIPEYDGNFKTLLEAKAFCISKLRTLSTYLRSIKK